MTPFPHVALLPDPAELDAVAARLGLHADAARTRASRLRVVTAGTHWRGPAADAFGLVAEQTTHELTIAATRLDDAAAALRRHTVAVQHTLSALAAVRRAVDAAGHTVGRAVVHEVGHDVARLAHLAGVLP